MPAKFEVGVASSGMLVANRCGGLERILDGAVHQLHIATVTLGGNEIHRLGALSSVVEPGPEAPFTNTALEDVTLDDYDAEHII